VLVNYFYVFNFKFDFEGNVKS